MYLISLLRDFAFGTSRVGGSGINVLRDGTTVHLVLYKFDTCRFCRRVFESADRLKVNLEYRDIRLESRWEQELTERTGKKQVPCLLIDGRPLLESAEIIQWLETHFSNGGAE